MYNIVKEEYPQLMAEMRDYVDSEIENSQKIRGKIIVRDLNNGSITVTLEDNLNIGEGSMVSVNDNLIGIISESSLSSKFRIELKNDISRLNGNYVSVDTDLKNIIPRRIEKVLEKIENDDLDDYDLHVLNCILGDEVPSYQTKTYQLLNNLNQSQEEAVNLSLNADDFHLILGPPGTGKTYVITEIIRTSLQYDKKILITAHTNRAVDNILEKFEDINPEKILRIGQNYSISPLNRKYSLKERRKSHPDWQEVQNLDIIIEKTSEERKRIKKGIKKVQENVNKVKSRKYEYSTTIKTIKSTIMEYEKKKEDYLPRIPGKNVNFDSSLKRKEKLEKNSNKYYSLAKSILNLENIEESLPDAEEFYELESTIKKMESEKFKKRLISIFNKSKYDEFLSDLKDKKVSYNLMIENYNAYWNLRDALEKQYKKTYPESEGKADEDALQYEIELLNNLDDYLSSKKDEIKLGIENENSSLIYDAYEDYIQSLNQKKEVLDAEFKYLNTLISLQINSINRLKEEEKNIQKTLEKYEKDRSKLLNFIDNDLLHKSQLIAATVLSSAHPILEYEIFDFMIMDEASQVAAYTSILPLMKCKKFILVGDNKQLQPITKDELSEKLNKSIFNHFIEKYPFKYSFLNTQYRMNKEIADLSSNLFYDGKIRTDSSVTDQTIVSLKTSENVDINFNNPLTFIDTANMKYYEEGLGDGCENCKESKIVVDVVKRLMDNGIDPHEIGVITPYKKQKNLINQHLKTCEVEVDTVYSFQGKEKEVIIMSFCKSKIGLLNRFQKKFIADPNQLNVSITRARKKLIIIGDSKTIKQSPLIKDLLETIGKSNTIKLSN